MTHSIDEIALSRAQRAGVSEKAGEITQEVRSHRECLRRGEVRQMSSLAQRVNFLDGLAQMGQKALQKI